VKESNHPAPERNDKRIHAALPIRVTYWDNDKKPLLEMACTYDISTRGARVTGLRCVKQTGEIVLVERGRSRAYCRVVWIGEPQSELQGQIGIQCVESERLMWEAEIRELEEVYETIQRDGTPPRLAVAGAINNRRRYPRFETEGDVEVFRQGSEIFETEGELRNLSELGCLVSAKRLLTPGSELKLMLNVGNYDLSLRGRVRHAVADIGLGIEFREIRKGDRQVLQFLLRKLAQDQDSQKTLTAASGR